MSDDFEDVVVDEPSTKSEQSEATQPQSTQKPATQPEKSSEELEEEEYQRQRQAQEDQQRMNSNRRQVRLRLIKEKSEIQHSAPAFLLDMAGIERFTKSYQKMGFLSLTFQSPTAAQIHEIEKQLARDLITQRIVFQGEGQFTNLYRFAASLKRLEMVDPQTKRNTKTYDFETSEEFILAYSNESIQNFDFPIRQRAIYLVEEFLCNSTIYETVMKCFVDFETHLSELVALAEGDPDFFQSCLEKESEQA